jgi:hypothetical protein
MSKRPAPSSPQTKSSSRSPSSRKRGSPRSSKTVFVGEIGVPIQTVVGFVNDIMRKEGFSQPIDNANAVIQFRSSGENCWCLDMVTEELAEKVCYLNKINYRDNLLRVHRDRYDAAYKPPRFSCWNEYYLTRYGENDPIVDVQIFAHCDLRVEGPNLVKHLNKKMKDYDLCADDNAIKGYREIPPKSFLLQMASPQQAEHICYLNNICIENTAVTLQRPCDWSGPKAEYGSLLEFLRARSDKRSKKREPKKQSIPSLEEAAIEILDDSDDDEVIVLYDNKEEVALQKEKKHLKAVLVTLVKSTETKAKETASLETEVASVEKQLSVSNGEVAGLQKKASSLKSDVESAQQQLIAVHQSWQEQMTDLSDKNQQIESLTSQAKELRKHTQNVTETLLDERKERRLAQEFLAQVQARCEEAKCNLTSVKVKCDDRFDV